MHLSLISLLADINKISVNEDLQCALNIYANKKV